MSKTAVVLKPMREIISEFGIHYRSAVNAEVEDLEPPREERLRVSGFPFCGLESAYKLMTKDEKPRRTNFGARYYTGTGTVAHEVIQDMLGLNGRMLGQWKCVQRRCGGKRLISRNNKCPRCGALMKYEELTVTAFKNVSGHLDGIYKTEDGEYFVIDYKTSSVRVITSQNENRTLPYHHNVCQIRAYCALIELMFDIKISGWMLVYIARDAPTQTFRIEGRRVTEEEKRKELKKIKRYDRHWTIRSNLRKWSDLQILIDEKPCKTKEDYDAEFASYTPCPLSQGGLCFQPKPLKNLLKIVWSDYRKTVKEDR